MSATVKVQEFEVSNPHGGFDAQAATVQVWTADGGFLAMVLVDLDVYDVGGGYLYRTEEAAAAGGRQFVVDGGDAQFFEDPANFGDDPWDWEDGCDPVVAEMEAADAIQRNEFS